MELWTFGYWEREWGRRWSALVFNIHTSSLLTHFDNENIQSRQHNSSNNDDNKNNYRKYFYCNHRLPCPGLVTVFSHTAPWPGQSFSFPRLSGWAAVYLMDISLYLEKDEEMCDARDRYIVKLAAQTADGIKSLSTCWNDCRVFNARARQKRPQQSS